MPISEDLPPNELEQRATTVVLIGRFNPDILQPMWFAAKGLLAERDVDADSLLVSQGFTSFATGEITIVCSRDRLQFGTTPKTPTEDILLDLITQTFELLAETPVIQLGVNHQVHIPKSEQTWDTVVGLFGDPQGRLVLLGDQELRTVELTAKRDDGFEGSRTIHIQPSAYHEGGVWFQLNDHVQIAETPEQAGGAKDAIKALREIWDSSKLLSEHVLRSFAPLG